MVLVIITLPPHFVQSEILPDSDWPLKQWRPSGFRNNRPAKVCMALVHLSQSAYAVWLVTAAAHPRGDCYMEA